MSPVGRDIPAGLKEYAAYKCGEKTVANLYTLPTIPEDVDVKSIRNKLGMTQQKFTSFGHSLSAIRLIQSVPCTNQVDEQVMMHDSLGAHARDELGISEPFTVHPVILEHFGHASDCLR
ncbi:MAG: hypothetical protein NTW74_10630 [Acidobacteria bacterium]|nr:hypothetical protein [Acidobacteriota bacterium]